jgi:hypothetical protein
MVMDFEAVLGWPSVFLPQAARAKAPTRAPRRENEAKEFKKSAL